MFSIIQKIAFSGNSIGNGIIASISKQAAKMKQNTLNAVAIKLLFLFCFFMSPS